MRIRPADRADVSAIEGIVQRAYGPYVSRIGQAPGPMRDDYAAKVARGGVFVAVGEGEVVGLIILVEEPGHLLVENVAVDPRWQGEGVGRGLLAFAEETARDARLPALRLYTHVAMTENQALYRRLGYRKVERRAEDGFERVFFVKPLGETPG